MINLLGHPTWVKVPKEGETVVLLHGGMSSSVSLLGTVGARLKSSYRIAAFDRRGHGRSPDNEHGFHYDDMAEQTIAFIEMLGRRVHVVGHSDGGNVGLLVALQRPDLIDHLVVVGANYHYKGLLPMHEMRVDSPDFVQWSQKYAALSPDGIEHAPEVLKKTLAMFKSEPTLRPRDLKRIKVPTLVMAGDDDVATLAHTCSLYSSIPDAQLAIIPGASHAVLKEHTKESVRLIKRFLRAPWPPQTYAPTRRIQPKTP
jgi:pimeloyl-ACP methyl ester carboxylesterase